MTEWLPIESAPKDGTEIIVDTTTEYANDVSLVVWCEADEGGPEGWWDYWGGLLEPKYWIPVPKKPVKNHYCRSIQWVCSSNIHGDLVVEHVDRHQAEIPVFHVSYCPFCGEKANDE